jgi:hypothetical protein
VAPSDLEDLLSLLRRHGVTEYSCDGLHLKIGTPTLAKHYEPGYRDQADSAPPAARPARSYDHPSLWPNGRRPEFIK